MRLDEDALKVIADMTRAEYFFAGNAPDLKKIYEGLNSKLVMEKKETEITAVFTAVAAMLALARRRALAPLVQPPALAADL